jgi:hypothetical protein
MNRTVNKLAWGYLAVVAVIFLDPQCLFPGKSGVLRVWPVLIACGVGLSAALIIGRLAGRNRAKSDSNWRTLGLVALLLAVSSSLAHTYTATKAEVDLLHADFGFREALARYASEHAGRLPDSLATLVSGGYIRRTGYESYEVPCRSGCTPFRIADPKSYDVMWGAHINEIDATGWVPSASRFVIRGPGDPDSADSDLRGELMSLALASILWDMREESTTQPAAQN